MKKILIILSSLLFIATLSAESWSKAVNISLNVNQNEYSDNWAGDDMGSISWALNANLLAEKQISTKLHNKNTLKLAFGQTHSQIRYVNADSTTGKKWAKPDKTTDIIDFESMLRFTIGFVVDPYTSFRWESQFIDRRGREVKNLNPNIFTESVGISRMFIKEKNKELSTRLGVAFKQYLDGYKNESTSDGGLEFVGEYKSLLLNNVVDYNTKLILFKALFYSLSDGESNPAYTPNWEVIRLNWEHLFSFSITKLIDLNLYFKLIYDERSIEELQFRETLGLGLSYKLF
ncbi:MAG: hypothetical protein K9N07_08620 [Candidatus Cloacimonetes bacterium]|nr:hypothetical protein [Candidatus Cloacimonadota bacterium]